MDSHRYIFKLLSCELTYIINFWDDCVYVVLQPTIYYIHRCQNSITIQILARPSHISFGYSESITETEDVFVATTKWRT
jgi:hypothetical protein